MVEISLWKPDVSRLDRHCLAVHGAVHADECRRRKYVFGDDPTACRRTCQHFGSFVPVEMIGGAHIIAVDVPAKPASFHHEKPTKRAPVTKPEKPRKVCRDCHKAEISDRAERCQECRVIHWKLMVRAGIWKPGRKPAAQTPAEGGAK